MYNVKLNKTKNIKCLKRHIAACQAAINTLKGIESNQRRFDKVYGRLTIDREHVMYGANRQ